MDFKKYIATALFSFFFRVECKRREEERERKNQEPYLILESIRPKNKLVHECVCVCVCATRHLENSILVILNFTLRQVNATDVFF